MASINSTGIGSGLDVGSIINALMSVERKPLVQLQAQAKDLNTELSAFGKLRSFAASMKDAAADLSSVTLWNGTTARSADESAVRVSSTNGAATGDYAVRVDRLATRQTVSGGLQPDASTPLGAGTLTIELGSWTGEPTPTGFTAKAGSAALNIQVDADDTLANLRDKINAAGAGVIASIVTDASGARLAIRSRETGAENGFRVTAAESVDDGQASTGLSAFGFDATTASPMTRTETAGNAAATISGIAVTSASNTLQNVADGLTLTLQRAGPDDVAVTVGSDDEAVRTAMDKFVTAFNDLARYIREQTRYDSETKTAGTLQGDRTAVAMQGQLRAVINQQSSASGTFKVLSDIGLEMKRDGTLSLNKTEFDSALANRAELRKVLAADAETTAASGFMDRFRDLGSALLNTDGAFDTRTKTLEAMLERNDNSQKAMELRLAATQARLEKQYQKLDENMGKLNGLSGYVAQQMALLNRNV